MSSHPRWMRLVLLVLIPVLLGLPVGPSYVGATAARSVPPARTVPSIVPLPPAAQLLTVPPADFVPAPLRQRGAISAELHGSLLDTDPLTTTHLA